MLWLDKLGARPGGCRSVNGTGPVAAQAGPALVVSGLLQGRGGLRGSSHRLYPNPAAGCCFQPRSLSSVALPRTPALMNTLELNKVSAAILTAGIAFMVSGQIGKLLVHGERPHESAIQIGEPPPAPTPGTGAPALQPISGL